MGWYKIDWHDLIGTDTSRKIVGANKTVSANISCDSGDRASLKLTVKVSCDFGSNADGNIIVKIYAVDRNAGEYDTIPIWEQRIQESPNTRRIITIPNLDVSALDTVRISIKNNDLNDFVYVWASYMGAYHQ